MARHYVDINGVKVAYRNPGEGTDVFLTLPADHFLGDNVVCLDMMLLVKVVYEGLQAGFSPS